jgi:putative alpha-1,2-mannosidase
VSRSKGSLSRRSPLGGVDVHFAAKVVVLGGRQQQQASGNVWCNGTLNSSSASSASCYSASSSCGVWLQFPSCDTTACSLLVSSSISFVSIEQAWSNMAAELPAASPEHLFQTVATRTQQIWRENLSRVAVSAAASREAAVKLYTAVYHTLMAPSIFSEGQIYPPPTAVKSSSSSSPSPSPSPVYRSFDGSVHSWPHSQPYLTDMSMYCTAAFRCPSSRV